MNRNKQINIYVYFCVHNKYICNQYLFKHICTYLFLYHSFHLWAFWPSSLKLCLTDKLCVCYVWHSSLKIDFLKHFEKGKEREIRTVHHGSAEGYRECQRLLLSMFVPWLWCSSMSSEKLGGIFRVVVLFAVFCNCLHSVSLTFLFNFPSVMLAVIQKWKEIIIIKHCLKRGSYWKYSTVNWCAVLHTKRYVQPFLPSMLPT